MSYGAGTEREIKLALDHGVALPDFDDLESGVRVDDRGVVELDASYFDTTDLKLSAAHMAVRRRRGHSWTYKGPSSVDGVALVREEREWPDSPAMPAELKQRLGEQIGDQQLGAVARLLSLRHRIDLIGSAGQRQLEIDDDDVSVIDGSGAVVERFREVEVEVVGPASDDLVAAVIAKLIAIGATPHFTSKYTRALRALGYPRHDSD